METKYENEKTTGSHLVVFINKDGTRLVRAFDSPYFAEDFIRKLKRSKKCTFISYTHY